MHEPRTSQRGISMSELLVSVAILALFLAVSMPALANYMRAARVRSVADNLTKDLSASRYAAVTRHEPRAVEVVGTPPTTSYTHVTAAGESRQVQLPVGVTIQSTTNFPVTFNAMGNLAGAAATCIVRGAVTSEAAHEYTITVNNTGKVSMTVDREAAL